MTDQQARRMGSMVQQHRMLLDWSVNELSRRTGLDNRWISRLENAEYREPAPENLRIVVDALGIEPADIDRASGGYLSGTLPEIRTYLRFKGHASPEEVADIERAVAEIQARYANPQQTDDTNGDRR